MNKNKLVSKDYFKNTKVGDKLRIFYNENNRNNKIIEIRAIIDDYYIVYKHYIKGYGYNYVLEDIFFFDILIKNNELYFY